MAIEDEIEQALLQAVEPRDPRFFDYSYLSMARDLRDANCQHEWFTGRTGATASCVRCGRYRPVEDVNLP